MPGRVKERWQRWKQVLQEAFTAIVIDVIRKGLNGPDYTGILGKELGYCDRTIKAKRCIKSF